jgi:hypothetical protein
MTNFVYDHIVAFIEDVSAPSPSLHKVKGRLEFCMKYAVLPDIYFYDGTRRNVIPEVFSERHKPERRSGTFYPVTDVINTSSLRPNFWPLLAFRKLFYLEKYHIFL